MHFGRHRFCYDPSVAVVRHTRKKFSGPFDGCTIVCATDRDNSSENSTQSQNAAAENNGTSYKLLSEVPTKGALGSG